jgi:hypothetical protein
MFLRAITENLKSAASLAKAVNLPASCPPNDLLKQNRLIPNTPEYLLNPDQPV